MTERIGAKAPAQLNLTQTIVESKQELPKKLPGIDATHGRRELRPPGDIQPIPLPNPAPRPGGIKPIPLPSPGRPTPLRPGPDIDPPGGDGGSFRLDPHTGKIERRPPIETLPWTPEDQESADRGWHYGVNPGTGAIERQPNVDNLLWTSEDQEIADRGWHYGVNPETGEIERQDNIQLL